MRLKISCRLDSLSFSTEINREGEGRAETHPQSRLEGLSLCGESTRDSHFGTRDRIDGLYFDRELAVIIFKKWTYGLMLVRHKNPRKQHYSTHTDFLLCIPRLID
jgi:hypothetical protein